MLVQRGGNADSDKVYIPNKTEIGGGRQHSVLYQCLQIGIYNIADIVLSSIDHIYLFLLHVKADGLKAMLRLIHRQRQPDIAQAANAHAQRFVLNFCDKLLFEGHGIFHLYLKTLRRSEVWSMIYWYSLAASLR